jgi:hypothetical protein
LLSKLNQLFDLGRDQMASALNRSTTAEPNITYASAIALISAQFVAGFSDHPSVANLQVVAADTLILVFVNRIPMSRNIRETVRTYVLTAAHICIKRHRLDLQPKLLDVLHVCMSSIHSRAFSGPFGIVLGSNLNLASIAEASEEGPPQPGDKSLEQLLLVALTDSLNRPVLPYYVDFINHVPDMLGDSLAPLFFALLDGLTSSFKSGNDEVAFVSYLRGLQNLYALALGAVPVPSSRRSSVNGGSEEVASLAHFTNLVSGVFSPGGSSRNHPLTTHWLKDKALNALPTIAHLLLQLHSNNGENSSREDNLFSKSARKRLDRFVQQVTNSCVGTWVEAVIHSCPLPWPPLSVILSTCHTTVETMIGTCISRILMRLGLGPEESCVHLL